VSRHLGITSKYRLPALSCTVDKANPVPSQAREEPEAVLGCFGNMGRNSVTLVLGPLTLGCRKNCKTHTDAGQGKARGQNAL